MKILLLSYYFSPGNVIGAIRFSKLAKFFQAHGQRVITYCGTENRWIFIRSEVGIDEILERDVKKTEVHYISHTSMFELIAKKISIPLHQRSSIGHTNASGSRRIVIDRFL